MESRIVWMRVFIFLASILFSRDFLEAQALPTASKGGEISIYGAYAHVWPHYGTEQDNGVTFGAEYTHFVNWFVRPSLELRGKVVSGQTVNQRTWGGGIRGQHRFGNFYPYIDFLISSGTITFPHPTIGTSGSPYVSDNSIVYSLGGGVDYDITSHFAVRADYQFEHWNLGRSLSFTPEALSIGVVYHPRHYRR